MRLMLRAFRRRRSIERRVAKVAVFALLAFGVGAAPAAAAPVWRLVVHHNPTNFPHESGQIWFDVYNMGDTGSSGTVTLTVNLPPGVLAREKAEEQKVSGSNAQASWVCPGAPGQTTITCTTTSPIPRHSVDLGLAIDVGVFPGAIGDPVVSATVSGGGATAPASASTSPHISDAPAGFGFVPGTWVGDFFEADGATPVRQAGTHPYQASFSFDMNTISEPRTVQPLQTEPVGHLRDLAVNLPPGFLGNPDAVSECADPDFLALQCPASSQVGRADLALAPATAELYRADSAPVFNLAHPRDVLTDLGFLVQGNPVEIRASLDPTRNYAVRTTVVDLNETLPPFSSNVTIWGYPKDAAHDSERCEPSVILTGGECPSEGPEKAFLTVPAQCGVEDSTSLSGYDTWETPGVFGPEIDYKMPGSFTGCDKTQEQFKPSISVAPTSAAADGPTGIALTLTVPQNEDPHGLEVPPVKDIAITLPSGMTVDPSFASGLQACALAQISLGTDQPASCPDASQIGTLTLKTPLLSDPLEGTVYLAQQNHNPFGSLLAMYLVIHDTEERGVLVKLAGKVELDAQTGRIKTVFADNPQFPFSELQFHLTGGPHAPLINPPTCGTETAEAQLTSYAAPETPISLTSSYATTETDGTACTGGGSPPFAPQINAGLSSATAGTSSAFTLQLTRGDGEANIGSIETILPPGLLGKIAGVPQCPEPQATSGECPASSQVGTTTIGSGAGPNPLYIPEPERTPTAMYLAGPYDGAPFSLVISVPAQAGPFDLGTVVVRAGIYINPATAQVTVRSAPLPQFLQGIAIPYRDIRVTVDRPGFMLAPTSCSPASIAANVTGVPTGGAIAVDAAGIGVSAAAGPVAHLQDRFQVGGCAALPFRPMLSASTEGHTSRPDGASLRVKIASPGTGVANIAKVELTIPSVLPSRLTTLQKACTETQFNTNPASCPSASNIATAVVHTPLLNSPLSGPVYFVSHGGAAFPDTEIVLQGEGVKLILDGQTQIKGGVTYSRFESVPDAPFTSFEFNAPEGPYSIFAANANLCDVTVQMPTTIVAQNGAVLEQDTLVAPEGCPDKITILSRQIKKRTLTLAVAVPAAGKLTARGKGIKTAAQKTSGRETITLKVTARTRGHKKISLTFTPSKGKKLSAAATAKFQT